MEFSARKVGPKVYTLENAMAMHSASSWPDTVRLVALPKKSWLIIDLAVLAKGRILRVQSGHTEHLSRAFAVAAGDEGRVRVDKAAFVEKFVDGIGSDRTHAEDSAEGVGAGAQMRDAAQELKRVALFLQGIIRGWKYPQLETGSA